MSWEQAKNDAANWLGTLKLGKDLHGQHIDLLQHAATLKAQGQFRTMVLRAAARLIKKRGGTSNISED